MNDPSAISSLHLTLGALEEAFQRAHAHARAAVPHVAAAAAAAHAARSPSEPSGDTTPDDEQLLDCAGLLRAAREPIEWLLALAHRLAAGDPEEVAAIMRLRAAFRAHLAGAPIAVRLSDVLIALALVVGALDPAVVLQGVSRTMADGIVSFLDCEGIALAAQLARIADEMPAIILRHGQGAHRRRRRTGRPTAL